MGVLRKCLFRSLILGGLTLGMMGTTAFAAFGDVTLKLGMSGEDVTILQTKLQTLGYHVSTDGKFGGDTQAAVMDFQADNDLEVDGIVGQTTFLRLNETKSAQVKYTVKPGDSLYRIAQEHGIAVADLARANEISDPAQLQVGQTLVIAPGTQVSRASAYGYRSKGAQIVAMAQRFLDVPYVWGGSAPGGFDCSGFTYYLFAKQGIHLPRMADEQFEVGKRVDKSALQPGDLVFFETYDVGASHVGIYMGNGKFIHASSGAGGVTITPLSKPYYVERYLGARRVM